MSDAGSTTVLVLFAFAVIGSLIWVGRDAVERGKNPLWVVPFCLATWPLGLFIWRSLRSRRVGERWPKWIRALVWLEAIMGIFVVAAVPADTPAQQFIYALLIGSVAYTVYRWALRRRQSIKEQRA